VPAVIFLAAEHHRCPCRTTSSIYDMLICLSWAFEPYAVLTTKYVTRGQ